MIVKASKLRLSSAEGSIRFYKDHPDVNGLRFARGNAGALRERMLACVRDPGLLARLRERAKPVKAISEAVDELLDTYRSLVAH